MKNVEGLQRCSRYVVCS